MMVILQDNQPLHKGWVNGVFELSGTFSYYRRMDDPKDATKMTEADAERWLTEVGPGRKWFVVHPVDWIVLEVDA
jgi:hypothetical protein